MDYEEIVKEQMENAADPESLNSIAEEAYRITDGLSGSISIDSILESVLQGESIFQSPEIISSLKSLFFYELKSATALCAEIISICIIMGLIKSLSDSFKSKSVSKLTLLLCTMVIAGISINSFRISSQIAQDSVEIMTKTMEILMPILIGILLGTGSIASGTVLSPLILASVTGFAYLMKTIVIPALFLSTVLTLLDCLTEKYYVKKLGRLLRSGALFLTGLVMTILSGIITIQGLLTETSDGLLINTAKYSISSFIPIVGGFTSDTVELFLQCMGSIRSVVGVFGILMLVFIMAVPLIKITAIGAVYKLTAALAEPVADDKITDGLNEMGNGMISMSAIVLFTSLLFILFITIIIRIGGAG